MPRRRLSDCAVLDGLSSRLTHAREFDKQRARQCVEDSESSARNLRTGNAKTKNHTLSYLIWRRPCLGILKPQGANPLRGVNVKNVKGLKLQKLPISKDAYASYSPLFHNAKPWKNGSALR
ncbi:hypothetical protein PI124_g415 [Phytophthora idaei]|nr:hypothetical protein PI125_g13011 [Phytophthora idaei]KAG3150094.1 hypothetical protein PI126_g11668 [Phytophthora idaei]KAG3255082.1 hypothetical protein PI124_g415 [Phytophthora idaei]